MNALARPTVRDLPWWTLATLLTALAFIFHIWFIFTQTPEAQAAAGGLAQKIFYFHVPSAYAMYLSGVVCFIASCVHLIRASHRTHAWATAGAEAAVLFGMLVLTSGPIWAKKAWGVYWTWDPRLTTSLLSVLLYVALVLLRRMTGDGEAERRFAAAFGILGTTLLPIIHYSVRLWGGNHPTVIGSGGGGLGSPAMGQALGMGFLTMTLLAALVLTLRARITENEARLREAEETASSLGLGGDD